jgi:hypothetical protein
MASQTGQTSTNQDELVHALNELDYHLQALKGADAWLDQVESLNAALGIESHTDRDLYKRTESDAVTLYAQEVVNISRTA